VIGEVASTPSSKNVWTRFWVTSAASQPNALTWTPARGGVTANASGVAWLAGIGGDRRPNASPWKPATSATCTSRRTPLASTKWNVLPANGARLARPPMQPSPVTIMIGEISVAAQLAVVPSRWTRPIAGRAVVAVPPSAASSTPRSSSGASTHAAASVASTVVDRAR
jgi:hypothetical protein